MITLEEMTWDLATIAIEWARASGPERARYEEDLKNFALAYGEARDSDCR